MDNKDKKMRKAGGIKRLGEVTCVNKGVSRNFKKT